MGPTVFRVRNFRFFFFSREETRIHVHVSGPDGEAKFWLEPIVSLSQNHGLTSRALKEIHGIIEDRKSEIIRAWKEHFER